MWEIERATQEQCHLQGGGKKRVGGRSYQDERIKNKSETGKLNETESGMGVKNKGGEEWGRNRRREKEIRQKNEEGEGSPGSDGRRGDIPPLYPQFLPQRSKFYARRQALSCSGHPGICLAQIKASGQLCTLAGWMRGDPTRNEQWTPLSPQAWPHKS